METKEQVKHTPGPWHLDGIAKHDSSHIISGPTQKWIAAALDFNKFDRDAEVEANARLIAAAPELMEACKTIVTGYDYNPGDSDLDDEQPIRVAMTLGDYRRATRAISEAKGR